MNEIKRGDIYYADLSPVVGSEQDGWRPVLIIQNDFGNRYSPTTIVAVITSQMHKRNLPTHVIIKRAEFMVQLSCPKMYGQHKKECYGRKN